ncbi:photosystem II reaction center PsbP [Trichothermofontia sp.]
MRGLQRWFVLLLAIVGVVLQSCGSPASGLNRYTDQADGYEFLYPPGWLQVQVTNGPDVVFHDLIETTENVSVVISPIAPGKSLSALGTPSQVGQELVKRALQPALTAQSNSATPTSVELVNAEAHEMATKTYYVLEYAVEREGQRRHNLASVVVSGDRLFTFNLSTSEQRWPQVQGLFKTVVNSFTVS